MIENEENLSTEQHQKKKNPWFSSTDEYEGREVGAKKKESQGAKAANCLVGIVQG